MTISSLKNTEFSYYGSALENSVRKCKALEKELEARIVIMQGAAGKLDLFILNRNANEKYQLPPDEGSDKCLKASAQDLSLSLEDRTIALVKECTESPHSLDSYTAIFLQQRSNTEEVSQKTLKEMEVIKSVLTRPPIDKNARAWLAQCNYDHSAVVRSETNLCHSIDLLNFHIDRITFLTNKFKEVTKTLKSQLDKAWKQKNGSERFSWETDISRMQDVIPVNLKNYVSQQAIEACSQNISRIKAKGHFGIVAVLLAQKSYPYVCVSPTSDVGASCGSFIPDTKPTFPNEDNFPQGGVFELGEDLEVAAGLERELLEETPLVKSQNHLEDVGKVMQGEEEKNLDSEVILGLQQFLTLASIEIRKATTLQNEIISSIPLLERARTAFIADYKIAVNKKGHAITIDFEILKNNKLFPNLNRYKECLESLKLFREFIDKFNCTHEILLKYKPDATVCETLQGLRFPIQPIQKIESLLNSCLVKREALEAALRTVECAAAQLATELDMGCLVARWYAGKLWPGQWYLLSNGTHLQAVLSDKNELTLKEDEQEQQAQSNGRSTFDSHAWSDYLTLSSREQRAASEEQK